MGYKCPNCHKDFGLDKPKLDEHFAKNPTCAAEAYVRTELWKISVGIKKPHLPYGQRWNDKPKKSRHYNQISKKHIWEKLNLVTNSDGSDTLKCKRCGLKVKRYYDKFVFDMRYYRKIENCID